MILGVYSVGCNRGPIRHRNVPDGPVFYLVKRGKGFLSSYWQVFSDIYRIIRLYMITSIGSRGVYGFQIKWKFSGVLMENREAGMKNVL